tara:strand:- start:23 stop:565 length:543 start_codon:yes stop_codon:yes gene_type:complete
MVEYSDQSNHWYIGDYQSNSGSTYKIIDNFLSEDVFLHIKSELTSILLPWQWDDKITFEDEECSDGYFAAGFYNGTILHPAFQIITPLLDKIDPKSLIRVKMNLYTRTENLIHHSDHQDYPFTHKGGLFSLNTCDGFTVIEGKEIKSVANRMIYFDPSILHHSTNCTNTPARMNINFNYF